MRLRIVLGVVLMVAGLAALPAAPASAETKGTATCQLFLPSWPGNGAAPDCNGVVVGVAPFSYPGICLPTCAISFTVPAYGDICLGGEPPLVGTANGEIVVNGLTVGAYQWIRIGAVLVFVPNAADTFAGVGVFLPTSRPIPTCDNPAPLNAQLIVQE